MSTTAKTYEDEKDDVESEIRSSLYDLNLEQLKLVKKVIDNIDGLQSLINIISL